MDEQISPYGKNPISNTGKVRIQHLREMKEQGHKWAMLTNYDMYTAAIFEEAGIPVLLVGDSASNNIFGYDTSLPITVNDLIPLVRTVSRSTQRALVIADLPFGSYRRRRYFSRRRAFFLTNSSR